MYIILLLCALVLLLILTSSSKNDSAEYFKNSGEDEFNNVPTGCPASDIILSLTKDGKYQILADPIGTAPDIDKIYDTHEAAMADFKKLQAVYPDCTIIDRSKNQLKRVITNVENRERKQARELQELKALQDADDQRFKNQNKIAAKNGVDVSNIAQTEQSSKQTNRRLQQIDNKLEREQQLDKDEHQEVRKLAKRMKHQYKKLQDIEKQNNNEITALTQQVKDLEQDIADANKLHREYPNNGQVGNLKREINGNRRELERQGDKLDKIEDAVEETKACMENSKTLLKDISSKLSNLERIDGKKRNKRTIKKIERGLDRCPPCPLYATTSPVDVLEVKRQGVGSIAPVVPYLDQP